MPRWSTLVQPSAATASRAGPPADGAIVRVGTPLSASAPRPGSAVAPGQPELEPARSPPWSVTGPHASGVLPERIEPCAEPEPAAPTVAPAPACPSAAPALEAAALAPRAPVASLRVRVTNVRRALEVPPPLPAAPPFPPSAVPG